MSFIVLNVARDEILEHVEWYFVSNPRAAERLVDLYHQALIDIAANPEQFPLMEMRKNPGNVRRVRLKRFPIHVCYQLVGSDIFVFAVAHTSRRPGYWRNRLQ